MFFREISYKYSVRTSLFRDDYLLFSLFIGKEEFI